ncbi:MAG: DUF2182 domain-containing protein [Alphaproteobacteria bacterium]|nr:MAG: DUF2182 domain-containing protein [Alphaproteobacteria bacterium]
MATAAAWRLRDGWHWLAFFGAVLLAWTALWAMSPPADLVAASRLGGAGFWKGLCTATADSAGFLRMTAMWAVMSLAMMAPTAFPAFRTFEHLAGAGAARRRDSLVLWTGYLLVWLGFSALAAGLQLALLSAGWVTPAGVLTAPAMGGAFLLLAGFYQFSALKDACLSACRSPLVFFMAHWEPTAGARGAFALGLRLGAVCLGCCWALMLLAFVGGLSNLLFMGLATVLMAVEKLPDLGRPITRPLGALLVIAGIGTLAAAWV